ncbi:COG0535 Predicted Fe-S oxidoreductases [uncultured Caudovirales phage]|uniref:COG0535 Predicted Fe-S oxidoreductases n=1 Tax=uncultured Caudovirales phage TaxID=2100421 RepID=A0A6J5L3F9_9CAUD|nr:COG0535 Predicted Fe-S oxidoreductases [uncultured Caudovirales phage]
MTIQNIHHLVIESTSYCNARCPHCPRFTETGFVNPDMPLAHLTMDALTDKFSLQQLEKLRTVSFEGDRGDPLMNPHIVDLVKFFSKYTLVSVITNGSIRNPKWWAEFAKIPNVNVVFSIDGLKDTNHIYRVGLDFNDIMANAQAFLNAGGRAVWKCIMFGHNEHQIADIVELSKNMGFAETRIRTAIEERFNGLNSWPVRIDGKYSHKLHKAKNPKEETYKHKHSFMKRSGEWLPPTEPNQVQCPWIKENRLYINYLGQVMPCCMMYAETLHTVTNYPGVDKFNELVGGNFDDISLYHHTFDEILQTPFYVNRLEESLASEETRHLVCRANCNSQLT